MKCAHAFGGVFALGFLLAPVARAGPEPADEALAKLISLEAQVAAHTTAKSAEALVQDAREAVALYAETAGKDPYGERLVKLLGGLSKHREDDVAKAGLLGLGETKDPDGARYVKSHLRPTKEAEPPAALSTAIQVAAAIPDDSLVEPLLGIVEDSENYAVAASAMESLGAFRASKRKRERILEALVKTVAKNRPGGRGQAGKENQSNPDQPVGNKTGEGASARWQALSTRLPAVLDRLTGMNVPSVDEWIEAVREHKRDLGALFRDE